MLLDLNAHRHTVHEVLALADAPINVMLTAASRHFGVRRSQARDLGQDPARSPHALRAGHAPDGERHWRRFALDLD